MDLMIVKLHSFNNFVWVIVATDGERIPARVYSTYLPPDAFVHPRDCRKLIGETAAGLSNMHFSPISLCALFGP